MKKNEKKVKPRAVYIVIRVSLKQTTEANYEKDSVVLFIGFMRFNFNPGA